IFTGNHDTERLGDLVRGDAGRAKIAMTLLATLRGIPQIFAGDELLLRSADLSQGHGGLRVDFPGGWAGDAVDLFDPAQRQGVADDLFDHTRRLFNWRKTKPVIHAGRTLHFASRDNTYAYFRYDDTDAVFVFINNSRGRRHVPWSHYAEITQSLAPEGRDVLTGEPVAVSDSTLVAPRSALVVEFARR
ncbi:MAG: cyclomaltodextrinase C-terminal domain-containing protein, partial [Alistipes sp.]|nr:cyclomaltodextrinase C-terminal domain-containing protein [Alistipes sp.]